MNFQTWVNRLPVAGPPDLYELAEDVRRMFFNPRLVPAVDASLMTQAPPIWQELNFKACVDGTVRANGSAPILRASWMPNQYLYRNDMAIWLNGAYSGSSQPVAHGDMMKFSFLPIPFSDNPTPYGGCDAATGQSGNPWNISPMPVPDPPDVNPQHAHFCVDAGG